jgi:murein DD-endopeptidase MepM/ murein hydrolase activator NlpD
MAFSPDFGRPAAGHLKVNSGWWADRGTRKHASLDIPLKVGTELYALDSGVVTRAVAVDNGDAGIWAAITMPQHGGLVSRHMHMSELLVKLGDRVQKGQVIGRSGNTGHSTGPHLHLDLKAPAALLPAVASSAAGKPSSGFGPLQDPYGYGIPGEPWVPVDEYRSDTLANAKKLGIPLYAEIPHGGGGFILKLVLAAFVAWGALKVLK